jgi:UDP-glucose 6-dehydrogenase
MTETAPLEALRGRLDDGRAAVGVAELGDGRRVLLLGVSFKKNVADVRNSSALELIPLLEARGLAVVYHDPIVPRLGLGAWELTSVALAQDLIADADRVVIHTDHTRLDYERSWRTRGSSSTRGTPRATSGTTGGRWSDSDR